MPEHAQVRSAPAPDLPAQMLVDTEAETPVPLHEVKPLTEQGLQGFHKRHIGALVL